jgi:hypothetical protein
MTIAASGGGPARIWLNKGAVKATFYRRISCAFLKNIKYQSLKANQTVGRGGPTVALVLKVFRT